MGVLGELLKLITGLGNGTSTAANGLGVFNWAVLAPLLMWLYVHRDDVLDVKVSFGGLAIAIAFLLFILELNRRIEPRKD